MISRFTRGACAEGHSRRARVRAQTDGEEIRGDWLLLRRHDCVAGGRAPGRQHSGGLLRRTDREVCSRASEGADYAAFWKTGPTYSEGEHRRGAAGESRGAGLLVRRGPWLQLQRSGELQRGSGEAGEGALAEVSEEASGVDFPYDLFSLMWSSPLHVLHLGQGRARAGLYRATLCRGAERRPGSVARRGDAEVTPAVFRLPTDFS